MAHIGGTFESMLIRHLSMLRNDRCRVVNLPSLLDHLFVDIAASLPQVSGTQSIRSDHRASLVTAVLIWSMAAEVLLKIDQPSLTQHRDSYQYASRDLQSYSCTRMQFDALLRHSGIKAG